MIRRPGRTAHEVLASMNDPKTARSERVPIERVAVSAHTIPTDLPESDGTIEWRSTTIVIAEVAAGGVRGLGYTYGSKAVGKLIEGMLADAIHGLDALATPACWNAMVR